MNRDSLAQYYSDNVGLIHVVAAKAHRRVLAVGGAYDYNDLYQDLTEVFIKSYDQFNDNLTRMKAVGQGLWQQLAEQALPTLIKVQEGILKVSRAAGGVAGYLRSQKKEEPGTPPPAGPRRAATPRRG